MITFEGSGTGPTSSQPYTSGMEYREVNENRIRLAVHRLSLVYGNPDYNPYGANKGNGLVYLAKRLVQEPGHLSFYRIIADDPPDLWWQKVAISWVAEDLTRLADNLGLPRYGRLPTAAMQDMVFYIQEAINRLATKYNNPKVAVNGTVDGKTLAAVVFLANKFVGQPGYASLYKTIVDQPRTETVSLWSYELATDLNSLADSLGLPPYSSSEKREKNAPPLYFLPPISMYSFDRLSTDVQKQRSSTQWIWWTMGLAAVAVVGVIYYRKSHAAW